MCSNTVHHRSSINGTVDPFPFSTFHFLRTCNRLLIPTDLRSYYNFTKNTPETNKLKNIDCVNDNSNLQKSELCSSINNLLSSSESSSKHNIINSSTQQQLPSISSMITTTVGSSVSSSSSSSPSSSTISRSGVGISYDYPNTFDTTEYPLGSFNRISEMNYSSIMNRRQRGEKRPIPDEQKDEKYYERRKRNNEAAKKSRDARKLREDRIAFRAAILEQENAILRAQLMALREEMTTMRQIMGTRSAQISVNL